MDFITCTECEAENLSSADNCVSCGSEISMNDKEQDPVSKFKVIHAIAAILNAPSRQIKGGVFSYKRGEEWDVKNESAIDFINKIENKFSRRSKLHGYMTKEISGIAESLKGYLTNTSDFISFTELVMAAIRDSASEAGSSVKGGNIVLIHYRLTNAGTVDNLGRLLVVMVDQKGVFDFNSNLQPIKFQSIDVNALRQAALFDLSLFDVVYPEIDGDPYLKFIEGKSNSNFFKTGLGCISNYDDKESIDQIYVAITNFSLEIKDRKIRNKVVDSVHGYIVEKAGTKGVLTLKDIQDVVNSSLPDGSIYKNSFIEYVNKNNYHINSFFESSKSMLPHYGKISINNGDNYNCRIKISSIGGFDSNKPVKLSEDGLSFLIPVNGKLNEETLKKIMSKEEDE